MPAPRTPRARVRRALGGLVLCGAVLLAGCTSPGSAPRGTESAPAPESTPAGPSTKAGAPPSHQVAPAVSPTEVSAPTGLASSSDPRTTPSVGAGASAAPDGARSSAPPPEAGSGIPATSGTPTTASTTAGASTAGGLPAPLPTPLPAPVPRRPAAAAQVLWATDPVELAVGASHAIFVSSPVAVLVSAGASSSSVAAAATRAIALGAPLLLAPDSRSRDGDTDLRRELARLGTHWILATDEAARRSAKPLPGEHVVTEAASLPALGLRHTADRLTMLVDSATATATGTGTGRAMPNGVAAARATAAAAGARIVPMDGSDPRTDPATIAALARHPPRHVIAVGPHTGSASRVAARVATAATGIQLPGGGQVMFPYRRLVALYGNPYDRNLGVLGHQGLHKAIARAKKVAGQYRSLSSVPVVPAFEIIATVATAAPGPDGDYSAESTVADLKPWVTAAGDAGLYVILDLQPGRAHLLDQAKRYRSLLELPYVGLALDPEWKLGPGQRPLQQIGSVDAAEVNQVIGWLGALTAAHHLPQKVLVLHQFRLSMLRDESAIDTGDDDVALVIHMDGQGAPHVKDATWRAVVAAAPKGAYFGWKDFYTKDTPMLSPRQTMAHTPTPLMISYQ